MLRSSILACGLWVAAPAAFAQAPTQSLAPTGALARATPAQSLPLPPAPAVGSDSCATPLLVVGNGPHAFDTTGATTGPEGQSTSNCTFTGAIGFDSDVWFEWVAANTSTYELTTCGLTIVNTKIAVYAGTSTATSCPLGGGTADACNDDINVLNIPNRQSRVTFTTTAGTHYLIQIGGFAGVPVAPQGQGQFQFDEVIVQPSFTRHDGSPEGLYRLIAPVTDTLWMSAQGDATTGLRNVTAVRTAIGATWALTLSGVLDGNPITLGVWEDPNDDGNPVDAVLLRTFMSTVSLANTDQLATYTLPVPVQVDRVFFVGASYSHGVNVGYPAPVDTNGCATRLNQAYLAGNAGPVDFTLTANTYAPFSLGGNVDSVFFMLEADTVSANAGTVFCIGDGVAPHTACPCGNNSVTADGVGCLSSLGLGGRLRASGVPSLSSDSLLLVGTQMPSSSCLYFQGTTQQAAGNGSVFGDGLRCAGGAIVRLATKVNVAGTSQYPAGGDLPVSVKGIVMVPGTRTYQAWYRNAAGFCTPLTFNLTNGLEILWGT